MASRGATSVVTAAIVLSACAGADPEARSAGAARATSVVAPTTGAPSTTAPPPATTAPQSTTTVGPISATAGLLAVGLPPVPGYEYLAWSQTAMDAFIAGSDYSYVDQFSASDVYRGATFVGRVELYSLEPQVRSSPDLDERVLDVVSGLAYQPGPQTNERLGLPGEQVLIRRTPRLVAWTWQEGGIVFTVVAEGIDPGEASDFVTALSAVQQGIPIPAQTATP